MLLDKVTLMAGDQRLGLGMRKGRGARCCGSRMIECVGRGGATSHWQILLYAFEGMIRDPFSGRMDDRARKSALGHHHCASFFSAFSVISV